MSFAHVFIMELEHGKYYVTSSTDPIKTMDEHLEGLGIAWTRIHRPLRILESSPAKIVNQSILDKDVKSYMLKYGVEHVRGGSWEQLRLTDLDRQLLHRELSTQNGCCIH